MNTLITGSAGFIGSNLSRWIIENTDYNITAIDDLSGGFMENMPFANDRFDFFRASVTDTLLTEEIFAKSKATVCFHLAAYAAEGRSNSIRVFNHFNNTVGTANIINLCIKYKIKLIFTSSVAVYSGYPPFDEFTVPNPIDEYGLSKYTSERSIKIAAHTSGLQYCIVRPRNVYGPGQSLWDSARNVMGIWMNQALHEKPLTIIGSGGHKRSWTYIDDIIEPLFNASTIRNETINLGSSCSYSIIQANMVMQQITKWKQVSFLPERDEVPEAFCETEKCKKLLGFPTNETTLFDGLSKMWKWAQRQPERLMMPMPPIEI